MTDNEATNAAIYELLKQHGDTQQHILRAVDGLRKEQQAANESQARMNGRMTHVEDRTKAHTRELGELRGQTGDLRAAVSAIDARTAAKNEQYSEGLRVAREERRSLTAKVWEIGKQVAGAAAVLYILGKAVADLAN